MGDLKFLVDNKINDVRDYLPEIIQKMNKRNNEYKNKVIN
jgi:hypothetical protein